MAVYVDDIIDYGALARARRLPGTLWCHLLADDREELHRFAARISLRRSWFQDHAQRWHYDLTPGKRAQAVAAGAVEISPADLARIIQARREPSTLTRRDEPVTTAADEPAAGPSYASAGAWSRFEALTVRTSEHHIWTGAVGDDGYGRFHDPAYSEAHDGVSPTVRATRWRLWAEYGPIPVGQVAMHDCDIPLCVRLECLASGTQSQNLTTAADRDRVARWSRFGGRRDNADRRTAYAQSLALRAAVKGAVAQGMTDLDELAQVVRDVLDAGDPNAGQLSLLDNADQEQTAEPTPAAGFEQPALFDL